ncbi:hypothetical protein GOBAR_AA12480 [Gossypium barbadense]|uniref:SWIM-type domain-containing protein n=1 Tax=Gossypium barbadense TaxID=3634 RepID=A0A2P5XXT3_GOSBA|nr:hypothetical protein GOBAR_AA12480 [Gossypium barbadense]
MKVLSIKYRFCVLVDPVTYDSFDIKGARSLEVMVQTHLASGSPYVELYVQFSLPNDAFAASTFTADREEYTTPVRHSVSGWQNMEVPVFSSSMEYPTLARHSVSGWDMHLSGSMFDVGNTYWGMTSTSSGWQSASDWRCCETSTRRDDVLPTTSTSEGTSFVADDGGSDDESDVDPPREPGPDGAEVALFFEPEPIPTVLEDVEGGSDEEEDPRFRVYSPPAHMHNVDLSQDDVLEFQDLPHRRHDRTSSTLDSGELEVGNKFSNKDSFLGALKQHSIMNGVNYKVVKSKFDKFEAKCVVQDGVSQDHPKMDSDMLATLILPTVKADPRTSVPVLIANIHSQLRYIPSYRKAWIAKQKALEKMHGGWDTSYNEVWQWCQVLERYVPGYEISKDHFHEMLAVLRLVNEEGANYLYNIPFKQWTQAYDGGLQYGQMTSNLAECINSILKGTRQMQGGHIWCAKVLQEINKVKARVNIMHTACHDRNNLWFRVTKFDRPHEGIIGGQYRVHLRNRTCDCGKFDALRYPCAHVIAACQNLRLDPMSYVDEVYKLETMYNVWRHVFPPVPDERNWPPVSLALFKLLPDRELRRKPKG